MHRRSVKILSAIAAASLALVACGEDAGGDGEASEVELTLVTAALDGTPNAAYQDRFLDLLEERSDNRISVERTEAYSLCDAQEVADCVIDGRADLGVTIPDYTPQYFPSTSMVSIPFIGDDWQGVTQSLYELHLENDDAAAVMEENGLHHISTWPVGRLLIGSEEPVESPEDLEGVTMSVSGPLGQRLFEESGANISALPANELYEGLDRGVIDVAAGGLDFPVNYSLYEVLPHWTDPGFTEYTSFGMWMNLDTYNDMPEDLREIVDEVTREVAGGEGGEAHRAQAEQQCEEMQDAPDVESMTMWDSDVVDSWREEFGDEIQDAWVDLAESNGLNNAQSVLDQYLESLEENAEGFEDATLTCVENYS